jgi:hypothetical protein
MAGKEIPEEVQTAIREKNIEEVTIHRVDVLKTN